jgi:hypothetical protein
LNDAIIIRGARTHNLKNISCEIPHGKLTVVSGVSGSGKSSLAFDTIYAEGQRRYVESLSAYARQFLERIEKPDVDLIDGLAPAIAIKQKNTTRNPRSTVATATEIYDYLRLLYARCGTVHCVHCDGLVKRDSMDEMAEATLALGEGTRLNVLFPVVSATPAPESGARRQAKPESRAAGKIRRKSAKAGGEGRRFAAHRDAEGAARRTAFERLQPALSAGPDRRVLHARVAAGPGLHASRLRPSGPHCRERREPRADCGRGGDCLPRGRRGGLRRGSAGRRRRSASGTAFPAPTSARAATGRARSRSRGCSASTIPLGPARAARASAIRWTST